MTIWTRKYVRIPMGMGMMAAGWMADKTRALIAVWGEANAQEQLDKKP